MAVIFFMILSGMVLPLKMFLNEKGEIGVKEKLKKTLKYAWKRYLRLLPVIVITILSSYFLMKLNGYKTIEVANVYEVEVIAKYFTTDVGILEAIFDAFVGAFISRPELNTPLWTMKYELWGAIATYIMVLIFKDNRYRYIAYGMICVIWFVLMQDVYFPCIVIGMIISDCFFRENKTCKQWKNLLLGIACVSYVAVLLFKSYATYFRICFAIAIVLFVLFSNKLQQYLENKLLLQISSYTYEIYAVHWIIICSLSCELMLLLQEFNYYLSTIFVFVLTALVTVLVSFVIKFLTTKISSDNIIKQFVKR